MKIINLKPQSHLNSPDIKAASALLFFKDSVFLCADDQYTLYELKNQSWINRSWPLAPRLPESPDELKKLKPDFEYLIELSDSEIGLFPSGSKPNRSLALVYNALNSSFKTLDLRPFFSRLSQHIDKINIEGAVKIKDEVLFLNRGAIKYQSSIIVTDAKTFDIKSIHPVDFGSLDDVDLHGSEICIHENHLYLLAVAEETPNSYDDGKIHGSALFKFSPDTFSILDSHRFDLAIKAEGLCRYNNQWLIVTDPDGLGISEFFTFTLTQ